MEPAETSMESSCENAKEVMYQVDYTDPKAFCSIFKRITGLPPSEYRGKYNRERAIAA